MRHVYSLQAVLRITGWSYAFLKQFIPEPLEPAGWKELDGAEREQRVASMNLNFSIEVFENMISQVCREHSRYVGILAELSAMQRDQGETIRLLLEIRRQLGQYNDLLTLKQVAEKLGMAPGTLRNKMEKRYDDLGNETGVLRLRGMTLQMFKSARGEWVIDALNFQNQFRRMGMREMIELQRNLRGVD